MSNYGTNGLHSIEDYSNPWDKLLKKSILYNKDQLDYSLLSNMTNIFFKSTDIWSLYWIFKQLSNLYN